jgi:hypothetical protein
MLLRSLTALALVLGLGGCASLKFYSGEDLTTAREVGLKTYYSKPYILVARDGTAKVISVSLIFLPDLAHPVFAKARSGYGSSNLSLGFSNSMLTSFGQQTDTKIPETITSLGGLETALGTNAKAMAEAAQIKHTIEKQAGDLGAQAEPTKRVADSLRQLAKDKAFSANAQLILNMNANLLFAPAKGGTPATGVAAALDAPDAMAHAKAIAESIGKITKALSGIKIADPMPEKDKGAWSRLASDIADLGDIQKAIRGATGEAPPSAPAALTLYEVVMTGPNTSLTEVPFGPAAK